MATKHRLLESQEVALRRAAASLKSAQEDLDYAQDVFVDAAHKALQVAAEQQRRSTGLHLPLLRDVMCAQASADRCNWARHPVRVLGSGPWEQAEFSQFLSDKGFEVGTQSTEVGTLVLGSHGFDELELDDLLRSLDDKTPIFTQELMVCGLIRNEHPYEPLTQHFIAILAQHPAVALILKSGRQWPVETEVWSGQVVDDQANMDAWEADVISECYARPEEISPLKDFGYNPSELKLDNWSRHRILEQIFRAESLPRLTSQEQQRWGASLSPVRLQAICSLLASLAESPDRQSSGVGEKLAADLEWLRARFYQTGMGFEWPQRVARTEPKRVLKAALTGKVKPDLVLAAVIGPEPLTRNEIVAKLWAYIKTHQLQDNENKKMINADDKLRALFGKEQVSMYQLAALISQHAR